MIRSLPVNALCQEPFYHNMNVNATIQTILMPVRTEWVGPGPNRVCVIRAGADRVLYTVLKRAFLAAKGIFLPMSGVGDPDHLNI